MKWDFKKLSELTSLSSGGTPKKSEKDYWNGNIPWYSSGELNSTFTIQSKEMITQKGLDKSNAKLFPKGALLIGMYDTAALKMSILHEESSFNQAISGVFPNENIDLKFVKYAIENQKTYLLSLRRGVRQKNLNLQKIKDIKIPDISLAEQKGIVTILEQAFSDIEKAQETAEKNLENAKELFDSFLEQTFSNEHDGWVLNKLKSITSKIGSGATPKGGKAAYKSEGMSLIRSMNVHDRRFKDKDLALIDNEQAAKLSNVELQKEDVLLNITGASVARCCVVPKEYLPARVNQHVSIVRVNENTINPELLCYLLTSKYYKDILLGIGEAGSTRQAITKAQIENFEISYPESMEAQDDLLQQLSVLEIDVLELQSIYQQKIKALDELKKSILQKAFTGELTKSKGVAA